jgi:hypothetical protein
MVVACSTIGGIAVVPFFGSLITARHAKREDFCGLKGAVDTDR